MEFVEDVYNGLNPFMNQVYFYTSEYVENVITKKICLNPFMNQVYFYKMATELFVSECEKS